MVKNTSFLKWKLSLLSSGGKLPFIHKIAFEESHRVDNYRLFFLCKIHTQENSVFNSRGIFENLHTLPLPFSWRKWRQSHLCTASVDMNQTAQKYKTPAKEQGGAAQLWQENEKGNQFLVDSDWRHLGCGKRKLVFEMKANAVMLKETLRAVNKKYWSGSFRHSTDCMCTVPLDVIEKNQWKSRSLKLQTSRCAIQSFGAQLQITAMK